MSALGIAGMWVAAVWVAFFTLNVVIDELRKPRAERSMVTLWNSLGAFGAISSLVAAALYIGAHS